jgi:hypothetical protein
MNSFFKHMIRVSLFAVLFMVAFSASAQKEWNEGELESVEIDIVKERQISVPKANRNFEKIPPRPSEPIKTSVQYDFRPFSFQTAQINPTIRPLKIKQEDPSKVYGGYVSAGYGNYASPYLEGFINTKRNKNKLVGAHAFLASSDKGPVDNKNSGSGMSGVSVYGRSFGENITVSGDASFENRATHFYGYAPGTIVDGKDIKQAYNNFKLSASIGNAKNSAFAYTLGGGLSYLMDKYDAKESQADANFSSSYKVNDESSISIKAGYTFLNRQDALITSKARSLFTVNPSYVFFPVEDLKVSAGVVAAVENDSIDDRNVHAYPDIHVSYPLSPSVDFVAGLTGGIERVSLQSLSRENLWIAPNISIFHTNKAYDFQVALRSKLANKIAVDGGFSLASLKNWYFFVNQFGDQSKFNVEYDKGATLRTNFFASIGFVQTESAKVLLRGDVFGYKTDQQEEAWHRPTYKVTGDVSFNIYKKILLGVNVIAQGGMKAKQYTTATNYTVVSLDPAFDLNARGEYILSDSFSFFVQGNNLTSNKYPLFMNYPVRGIQVLAGLTWRF